MCAASPEPGPLDRRILSLQEENPVIPRSASAPYLLPEEGVFLQYTAQNRSLGSSDSVLHEGNPTRPLKTRSRSFLEKHLRKKYRFSRELILRFLEEQQEVREEDILIPIRARSFSVPNAHESSSSSSEDQDSSPCTTDDESRSPSQTQTSSTLPRPQEDRIARIARALRKQMATNGINPVTTSSANGGAASTQQLLEAAMFGHWSDVFRILDEGAPIEARDESNGYHLLHWAISNAKRTHAEELLKRGADPDSRDLAGWTPLHFAAHANDLASVRLLLKYQANPTIKNSKGKKPSSLTKSKDITALLKQEEKKAGKRSAKTGDNPSKLRQELIQKEEERRREQEKKKAEQEEKDQRFKKLMEDKEGRDKLTEEEARGLVTYLEGELKKRDKEIEALRKELEAAQNSIVSLTEERRQHWDMLKAKSEQISRLEVEVSKSKVELSGREIAQSVMVVNPADIVLGKLLGKGSFGEVYEARWKGETVAVKKLIVNRDKDREKAREAPVPDGAGPGNADGGVDPALERKLISRFQEEALVLSKTRHTNIVLLLGVSFSFPNLYIVMELMSHSLESVIHDLRQKLPWRRRVQIARDVAKGMNFLHQMSPPIVHRDLKSSNLLVDEYGRVKVSDFGCVGQLKTNEGEAEGAGSLSVQQGMVHPGTAAYMSPESLRGEDIDVKSDVFSYGVVVWELMTREKPWRGKTTWELVATVGWGEERLPLPSTVPDNGPQQFISLIRECWQQNPKDRPSFELILDKLNTIRVTD